MKSYRSSCLRLLVLLLLATVAGGIAGAGTTLWLLRDNQQVSIQPDRLLASLQIVPVLTATPLPSPTPSQTPRPTFTPTLPTLAPTTTTRVTPLPVAGATDTVAQMIARVNPAVVTVVNTRDLLPETISADEDLVWGSGVIIDARGYVLTNEHVAGGSREAVVILDDGTELLARYVAGDAATDLAVLHLERPARYSFVPWGDSTNLKPGEDIWAVGSALGNLPNSVTSGIVSGLHRSVAVDAEAQMDGLVQIDAAINHGNSGGALINRHGELVGITALLIRRSGPKDEYEVQGVGFAVPSSTAQPLATAWLAADISGEPGKN